MTEDPITKIENIPIDFSSKAVVNCKSKLESKLPKLERLLTMYKMKKRAFEKRLTSTFQSQQHAWVSPQIELTKSFIEQTQRCLSAMETDSFTSSHLLDFLEYMYAIREKQKWINSIDIGTNTLGPMSVLQIQAIHLIVDLLKALDILDLPKDEELPEDPDTDPAKHLY